MSNQGKAGSFIDFQIAVEQRTAINSDIQSLRPDWKGAKIKWYSPIKVSGYKEFHDTTFWNGRFKKTDSSFWEGLGDHISFQGFWPKGGPSWDGLAVLEKEDGHKTLLLFEAKSHKGELISYCSAKNPNAIKLICRRLNIAQEELGLNKKADLMIRYYQFANRLAHLHFLQSQKIDVALINILFANDPYWNSKDKTGVDDWKKAQLKKMQYFGIDDNFLLTHCIYERIIDLNSEQYADVLKEIKSRLKNLIILPSSTTTQGSILTAYTPSKR